MSTTEAVTTLMNGKVQIYAAAMKKLINNETFSDVKFHVGVNKVTIHAHQSILAAHCAVFKAMFLDINRETDEMQFDLVDMTPRIFLAMLEYIYTNQIRLNSDIAVDVLATALEYGLDDLRDLCVEFLIKNLTVSNACDVMQTAVTYNQNDLKEMAIVFIENNTQEVLLSEIFKDISEDALVTIIRSDKLNIDEIDLIKAVKMWATVNSEVDKKEVSLVGRNAIKHLRLPLLSLEELGALENENKTDFFLPAEFFPTAVNLNKQGNKGNPMCTVRRGTFTRPHHSQFNG
ncbi:BTB/POZ domain-containing protein 19-like [Plakobranchus ocellatus]|uniref:BTB/POZ domain-containing protein 19-like n=1 Tax=Plakobranchus ocellatus TaxID=259542 RepID=A0AAV4DUX5_9GAST|nr:BTB/POZ domain-containing protein 19-like [Plakobranchus ocellatus]